MGAGRKQILNFLDRFKRRANQEGIHLQDRKKNLDSLAKLGLSIEDAEEIMLALTEDEYVSGPENDADGSEGEVWVFGASIEGCILYIKLKLDKIRSKCISFHKAERSLDFPLRKGE